MLIFFSRAPRFDLEDKFWKDACYPKEVLHSTWWLSAYSHCHCSVISNFKMHCICYALNQAKLAVAFLGDFEIIYGDVNLVWHQLAHIYLVKMFRQGILQNVQKRNVYQINSRTCWVLNSKQNTSMCVTWYFIPLNWRVSKLTGLRQHHVIMVHYLPKCSVHIARECHQIVLNHWLKNKIACSFQWSWNVKFHN